MKKRLQIALIAIADSSWMGGMEYVRNIILALAGLPQDVRETFEVSLLINSVTDQKFVDSVRPFLKEIYNVNDLVKSTIYDRIKAKILWRIFNKPCGRYDVIIKKKRFDFVYPANSPLLGFSMNKVAAWIPDFQHKYLPELFTEQEINGRDKIFSLMALKAPLVVMSSNAAEADFKKFYPGAAFKAKVLPFKVISQPEWYKVNPLDIQHKYNLPDKFFIISNQFWQHKNHIAVFKAMKLLKERNINPVVVCTGRVYDYRKPEYSDIVLQTIHTSGLARQIFLLGLIPKTDQIQLLRRSIALIQPSLFEGWSTVVEDARCLGKPIILSDFAVHLEQNPPNSRFFDRTSPESLAEVMAECWEMLSPGPDSARELAAQETNRNEVAAFAKSFLQIATSVNNNMV